VSDRELYCDTCESVQLFEVPPCVDGHDADCPELVCTGCGTAMLIATFSFPATQVASRPPRRHAA
jgi:hypothetical protein